MVKIILHYMNIVYLLEDIDILQNIVNIFLNQFLHIKFNVILSIAKKEI